MEVSKTVRIMEVSKTSCTIARAAAGILLVFLIISLWVFDFEPLLSPISTQAYLYASIAAILVILSTLLITREVKIEYTMITTLMKRALLSWLPLIPAAILSVISLSFFLQCDLTEYLYIFIIIWLLGMIIFQLVSATAHTIVHSYLFIKEYFWKRRTGR